MLIRLHDAFNKVSLKILTWRHKRSILRVDFVLVFGYLNDIISIWYRETISYPNKKATQGSVAVSNILSIIIINIPHIILRIDVVLLI